jgi:ParB family chromosome partitioning protein
MLIAGERRYRVLKDLGRESLLAIVLPVSEQEARELALIDNLQRADLSPFEEAAGYQELIDDFGFTQEQIALKVGKDQTVVSNTLTINKLPENIRKDELAQQASKSVLLELARVSDPKELKSLWSSIKRDVKQGIAVTVRGVRDRRSKGGAKTPSPTPSEAPDKVVVASKQFSRQLAELTPDDLASSPERQETLRAIKERLDELFAGVPEVSPAPEERGEEEAVA